MRTREYVIVLASSIFRIHKRLREQLFCSEGDTSWTIMHNDGLGYPRVPTIAAGESE